MPRRIRLNRGSLPEAYAAKVPFTELRSSGSPASSQAAACISRARIGSPASSSTIVTVSSTGLTLVGAG